MPLANTRVFHPRFVAHHRPVSESAMESECIINRPNSTPTAWDEAAGRSTYPTPTRVYTDVCRITKGSQPGSDTGSADVADRITHPSDYTIAILVDSGLVQVNDILTVTSCSDDPQVVGRPMTITGVRRGSVAWERVLSVQFQAPTTR